MAQTSQFRSGGTSSTSSSTPLSPEQQLEEDTRKAIALSLESAQYEDHQRNIIRSPVDPTTPSDVVTVKTPKELSNVGSTTSGLGNLNDLDPFSIGEQTEQPVSSEADLMCFSFDHVLKNYNRQQKTTTQVDNVTPHSPSPAAVSQFMQPAYPINNQKRTLPSSHTATLPSLRNNQFGTQQRPNLVHQQSFPVQTASTNPFSVPSYPAPSSTNPFASSWAVKPDNKTLKDLSVFGTLPKQSRSSPPSPTPNLFDIDKFLLEPNPSESKSPRNSENPFTTVPHGQPLPRSAADELMQMLQDPSPSPSDTEYKHPPTLPQRQVEGQSSQQQGHGSSQTGQCSQQQGHGSSQTGQSSQQQGLGPSQTGQSSQQQGHGSNLTKTSSNFIQKIAPPAQTIRRNNSQPSLGTMAQAKTTQPQRNNNCGFHSIRNSDEDISAPPLPPKMYTNTSAGAEILPVHPPSSSSRHSATPNDLIVWSPNKNAGFTFDDNFDEFDPLKVAEKKAALRAAAEAAARAAAEEAPPLPPKGQADVVSKERPASYSNTKEIKVEKLTRPRTVHGPRPRSLEMGKTEKWARGNSTKTKPEKAFFGDGLFDLAAERDEEAIAFAETVRRLRDTYLSSKLDTNPGYVRSPIFAKRVITDMETSVKIVLIPPTGEQPTTFTCDVNTLVQHIISQGLCYATDGAIDISSEEYVLKVPGRTEYLDNDVQLSHYEYVQECRKFDRDVRLVMLLHDEVDRSLARTQEDDETEINISSFANLFDRPITTSVSRMGLTVLLDALTAEGIKLRSAFESGGPSPPLEPLIQVVKAICHTLASVESNSIASAIQDLQSSQSPVASLERLTDSVLQLVDTYCQAFDTDFGTCVGPQRPTSGSLQDITTKGQNLRVCIQSAHRLPNAWKTSHEYFVVTCFVCYGGKQLEYAVETKLAKVSNLFFDKISWSSEVEIPVPVSKLPRESRLCLTLYAVDPSSGENKNKERTALGWVAIPLFTFRSELQSGSHLLGLWPGGRANPIGTCASNLLATDSVILQIDFNQFRNKVIFPPIEPSESDRNLSMDTLDSEVNDKLMSIIEKDSLSPLSNEDATLLWNKRHYCCNIPSALSRILVVAPSWDWACLADIYGLLQKWTPCEPMQALELLHARFADRDVRSKAVEWIRQFTDDELSDYLPQLVQALKYETYHDSALASFLIERALCSIRIAHYLFWYLKDSLRELQFSQRVQMVLGALLSVCGQGLRDQFTKQEMQELTLSQIAQQIKSTKDGARISLLQTELGNIPKELTRDARMPTSAGLEACDLNAKASSYFSSFTVPIRLVYSNADPLAEDIVVMFKAGEDMRQDMLTMQMIRIMDKLWLSEGLDLRMITFRCMATGPSRGFVELVKDSETLRKIQVEYGVTGSFKDKTLAEWLKKYNPTELDYLKAVENFTYSCAGYCVATYVLGIGDRHNDNIMVTKTGHMFHVDFFRFLGNAQMFGNVKRDRVPFVLTSDMAYVINGGDKPSPRFQEFVDLCCEALNLVRRHSNLFFNLFGLMLNAGIHQLSTPEDLKYVQNALKPQANDVEATAMFTRLIEVSLGSRSTQINFFIHNLAHHSFTAANSLDLSFAPKRYSMDKDGKITQARIFGIQKRYENAKYYVYIIKVLREGSTIPSFIFRRYREFQELNIKLRIVFPQMQTQLPMLSTGPLVGRTHVKQVAEKRKKELDDWIQRLMHLTTEISEHDLVYTFFHPLLKDEKDAHLASSPKLKQDSLLAVGYYGNVPHLTHRGDDADGEGEVTVAPGQVSGQVKLSINYKDDALFIMVRHAKDLVCPDGSDPDPYVKTYLQPDPHKVTKRKTRMVKKSRNPTYNEMLVYNKLSKSDVKKYCIRVTVWNSDYLKENAFLGGIDIPVSGLDLTRETQSWYRLGNLGGHLELVK